MATPTIRTVTVQLPFAGLEPMTLHLQPGVTVGDLQAEVESQLAQNNVSLPEGEFGMFETAEKLILNASPPIPASRPLLMVEMDEFTYDRAKFNVTVRFERQGGETTLLLESHTTIGRVIKDLRPTGDEYEIRLLTSHKKTGPRGGAGIRNRMGVKLNPHRTLRSYRLKDTDILVMHIAVTNSGIWRNVAGSEKLAVIISIPQPWNLSKAMKMDAISTLGQTKREFLSKIYLNVPPSLYGLYVRRSPDADEELLPDTMGLCEVDLRTPMRMTCRLLPSKPAKLFGTDPEKLEMVDDGGLLIPRVLLLLKELLLVNNGLTVEGLFRRSGSEVQMKLIREQLEQGKEVSTKDVHSVATLIKRWFKELPVRLLVSPEIPLAQLVDEPQRKLELPGLLSPLYGRLLTWLYTLCMVLIENYETTKMDAKNLAIVWGPAVVPEASVVTVGSFAGSGEDLAITGYGVDLIESNLRFLAASGELPLDRLRDQSPTALTTEAPAVVQLASPLPKRSSKGPATPDAFDAFRTPPPQFRDDMRVRKTSKSSDRWLPVRPNKSSEMTEAQKELSRTRSDTRMRMAKPPAPAVIGPPPPAVTGPPPMPRARSGTTGLLQRPKKKKGVLSRGFPSPLGRRERDPGSLPFGDAGSPPASTDHF